MKRLVAVVAMLAMFVVPSGLASADRIPHTSVVQNADGSITVTAEDTPDEINMGVVQDDRCGSNTNVCVYINSVGQPLVPESGMCRLVIYPPYDGGDDPSESHPAIFSARCPRGPIKVFLNGGSDLISWTDGSFYAGISVNGGDGDDEMYYGHYTGNLFGEGGDDIIQANGYQSVSKPGYASPAEDLTILNGGDGNDLVVGMRGLFEKSDKLVGGPGKDRLYGLAGDDILVGSQGAPDLCDGGPGKDKGSKSCERMVKIP